MHMISKSLIDQYADQAYELYGGAEKPNKAAKGPSKNTYPDVKGMDDKRGRRAARASKRGME